MSQTLVDPRFSSSWVLATRIATLLLLGMIAVIQMLVYPNAYNEHLVWGAILALLLTRGAGMFSVDYLINRYVVRNGSADARLFHVLAVFSEPRSAM